MTTDTFCSQYSVERRNTGSLKWDSLQEVFGDAELTPLWVADMEFKAPKEVTAAIIKRAEHGAFGYGKVQDSYYEAFANWQKQQHNMDIQKEEICFSTGVVGALYNLVNTFTKPEDPILICPPVYYPFYDAIQNTHRKLVTCALDNTGGYYTLDLARFEDAIVKNRVKMFIFCSPHNPVSRVWSAAEMKAIFHICQKYGVLVVSDEIHQDFTYHKNHPFIPASVLENGRYKDSLIVLNSGSKSFNLAGLSHSHTIIFNKNLRHTYNNYIKTIGSPEINIFGLLGMETAFRYGENWLTHVKDIIFQNYSYLCSQFATYVPKIIVTPLEGTYLSWIDLRKVLPPEQVTPFIQGQCRLAVDFGEWFCPNAKGFIRINLATDPKYIKLAIENIVQNLGCTS